MSSVHKTYHCRWRKICKENNNQIQIVYNARLSLNTKCLVVVRYQEHSYSDLVRCLPVISINPSKTECACCSKMHMFTKMLAIATHSTIPRTILYFSITFCATMMSENHPRTYTLYAQLQSVCVCIAKEEHIPNIARLCFNRSTTVWLWFVKWKFCCQFLTDTMSDWIRARCVREVDDAFDVRIILFSSLLLLIRVMGC